jgi:hypothetical protein
MLAFSTTCTDNGLADVLIAIKGISKGINTICPHVVKENKLY